MAFQVMGVTAGRKDSNCEILLKEALLACREQGAEVRMINLKDYELLDCNGCTACTMGMSMGKNTGWSLADKDDKQKIMDVMLEQDAVIFSAPTYDLMPSSLFLKFMHRNLAYESAFLTKIGAIAPRDRVGALIAVVDALPVLGSGTVLLPWAAVSLLRGSGGLALGLTVTYAAAAFARSALEPRLLGRQIGLPPLLTLLSLYAGYRLFGLAGMILLPLAVLLAKQVWELAEGNGGGIDGAL